MDGLMLIGGAMTRGAATGWIESTSPASCACLAVKIWPVATLATASSSSFGRPAFTISLNRTNMSSTSRTNLPSMSVTFAACVFSTGSP